jgi:hypothetical protein
MNLRGQIDRIRIIDDHVHALDGTYWIDAVGGIPFPPEVHGLEIPSETTPLTRAKKLTYIYQELYNFRHSTITPRNHRELQELHESSKSNEAELYHKAIASVVLWLCSKEASFILGIL